MVLNVFLNLHILFLFFSFLSNKIFFIAQGRWASLMQRCLRFFEKMTCGFFQFQLR